MMVLAYEVLLMSSTLPPGLACGEAVLGLVLSLGQMPLANLLKWMPTLTLQESIVYTVNWYKESDVSYDFCASQIHDYCDKLKKRQGLDSSAE